MCCVSRERSAFGIEVDKVTRAHMNQISGWVQPEIYGLVHLAKFLHVCIKLIEVSIVTSAASFETCWIRR